MQRITPEMVIEAYKKTKLTPMQGNLFPAAGCACALGAFAAANGHPSERGTALMFLNSLTSSSYVNAFGCGFDGDFPSFMPGLEDAYEDGKAAWEAVNTHLLEEVQG